MTLVIGALALFAAVALAGLTTRLRQISATTSAAVESVRLGHEVEIDLILHDRVDDELVRTDIDSEIHRRLAQAHDHVASPHEAELLARAEVSIDAYLDAIAAGVAQARRTELQGAAHGALRELVDLNVLEARAARETADRWDETADMLAILLALATATAGAWLVWWLRARAIVPLLALTDTVERFGRGEKDVRADESGPQELGEVAVRFNRMADALASQRAAQLAHLAAVAHDLRNPLWVLQLSLDSARSCDKDDPARSFRSLDNADQQVGRLKRMIDDLLDASNIEAGHLELRHEMLDLRELVRELSEQFVQQSAIHRIEWKVPQEPVPAIGDAMRIGQVVTNLLTNAIKYSPSGGLVRLDLCRDRESAVISVADEGVGIAAADLPELFEPFRRLTHARHTSAGTGLGLFVVQRLVQAHGGEIAVESAPTKGSTFRVRLPLVQTGITADNEAVRPQASARQ
jgi:signal transduction histidine kinase